MVKFNGVESYLKLRCLIDGYEWQSTTYSGFMRNYGCPICKTPKLELKIKKLLNENNINHISQYKFKDLKLQSLDFYLPDYNIAIECQGIQHFKPIYFFGGDLDYIKTLERDQRKFNICKNNNIKIIYYTDLDCIPDVYYDKIFTDDTKLILELKKT